MKTLLLILWLSAFLTGMVRAGDAVCSQRETAVTQNASTLPEDSTCTCCEGGPCACSVEPAQETPGLPSPALPPSPDNSGKLLAARLAFFLVSPAAPRPPDHKSQQTPSENTADSCGDLPLHIRYCARLW